MTTLRAMRPILYRSTQYREGDALPADHEPTVAAWLEAGSAKWIDDEGLSKKAPKAKPVTAPPGQTGLSSDGDPDARVGHLPDKPSRKSVKKSAAKKGAVKE